MNSRKFPTGATQPALLSAEEKINETNPDIKYIQTHEPAGIVLQYDPVKKDDAYRCPQSSDRRRCSGTSIA